MLRALAIACCSGLMGLVAQAPAKAAAPDDAQRLAASLNAFGDRLAAQVAKADQNLCLSPASAGLALLMLLPGARGVTDDELRKLLLPEGWDAARATAAAKVLRERLAASERVQLAIANDLWLQQGLAVEPDYATALQRTFGAAPHFVDFERDAAGAVNAINAHVATATCERIPRLLASEQIEPQTRLLLTNTIYLRAPWWNDFDRESVDRIWHVAGKELPRRFMHQQATVPYATAGGVQLVQLPFKGRGLALEIALAAVDAPLADAVAALAAPIEWKPHGVEMVLPRFGIDTETALREPLRALGLTTLVSEQADLAGIAKEPLRVGMAQQRVILAVDEEGCEASAYTGITGIAVGSAPTPVSFVGDRPFAFTVRDLRTGLVLFAGRVVDPTSVAPNADADAAILAAYLNAFGRELLRHLDTDQNLCLSPASAGLALLMLLPGARGATADELRKLLLPKGWDAARATAAAKVLRERLAASEQVQLAIVNDLWLQDGLAVETDYATTLQRDFGAAPRFVDFAHDAAKAVKAINAHVAAATRERIPRLLASEQVDSATRFVLTNALTLHAEWEDELFTKPKGKFERRDKQSVECEFVGRTGDYVYVERYGVQLIRLPYRGGRLALDLALPSAGTELEVAHRELESGVSAPGSGIGRKEVVLRLPRVHFDNHHSLIELLHAAGLKALTTAGQADLSGIARGIGALHVSAVEHATSLHLDEKGTDAAGATAILGSLAGASDWQPLTFTADHCFAFALRDLRTGLILFAGQVVDPTAK